MRTCQFKKFTFVVGFSFLISCMVTGLQAQTVMLPTFRNFTVQGSVSVPDGGMILMGGIRSHSEGAVSRGVPGLGNVPFAGRLFKNRAIGRETGSSQLVARPQIIIQEELEQQVLAEAQRRQTMAGGVNALVKQKAAFLSKHVGKRAKSNSKSRYGNRR